VIAISCFTVTHVTITTWARVTKGWYKVPLVILSDIITFFRWRTHFFIFPNRLPFDTTERLCLSTPSRAFYFSQLYLQAIVSNVLEHRTAFKIQSREPVSLQRDTDLDAPLDGQAAVACSSKRTTFLPIRTALATRPVGNLSAEQTISQKGLHEKPEDISVKRY